MTRAEDFKNAETMSIFRAGVDERIAWINGDGELVIESLRVMALTSEETMKFRQWLTYWFQHSGSNE